MLSNGDADDDVTPAGFNQGEVAADAEEGTMHAHDDTIRTETAAKRPKKWR